MVVMVSPGWVMLNDRVTVLVCAGLPESVTLNAGYTRPSAVGVPVTAPVALFRVKPGASVLPPASDQV